MYFTVFLNKDDDDGDGELTQVITITFWNLQLILKVLNNTMYSNLGFRVLG